MLPLKLEEEKENVAMFSAETHFSDKCRGGGMIYFGLVRKIHVTFDQNMGHADLDTFFVVNISTITKT